MATAEPNTTTQYAANTNKTGKLAEIAQEIVRKDGESVPMAEVVTFPNDLGQAHHPDHMIFYFLDIVTGDNKFFNDSLRKSAPITVESVSSQTSSLGKVKSTFEKGIDKAKEMGGSTVSSTFDANDTYKKTGDAVKLMMPVSVQFNDGAGWQAVNASPTGIGMIANSVLGEGSMIDSLKAAGGQELGAWVSNLLNEGGEKAFETIAKKVFNPYVSQAFEAMQRRQFRFDWTLVPKNNTELNNVKKIINMFRYHMHPSLVEGGAFLKYPSQVDIQFLVDGGAENTWLPKVTTCVIKDFNANYTPNNQWSTVNNETSPGAPYQYQISLVVEEITPLVKQDISRGY